jgi:hypothetical protein
MRPLTIISNPAYSPVATPMAGEVGERKELISCGKGASTQPQLSL